MNHASNRFPNHKFDFDATVFIPHLQIGGHIEGIWYSQDTWHYRINGIACHMTSWFTEDQLVLGCPQCLTRLPLEATACPACGNPLD